MIAGFKSGWIPDKTDSRDWVASSPKGVYVPTEVVPKWPFAIREQGSRRACVHFAGTSMAAALDLKDDGIARDYSALHSYRVTNEEEGGKPGDDNGSMIRSMIKGWAKRGMCLESEWPYHLPIDLPPDQTSRDAALLHQALYYYRCPTLSTVRASLYAGYPVALGFLTPTDMDNSGDVRYPGPSGTDGAHAVLAIGYDGSRDVGVDRGALLCVNSWGAWWGHNGLMWLPYRYVTDGLASDMWTVREFEL